VQTKVIAEEQLPFSDDALPEMAQVVGICRFTCADDAEHLSQSRNWGLVRHLIHTESGHIPQDICRKIFSLARKYHESATIQSLYNAGS
jgi:hypothetical protein